MSMCWCLFKIIILFFIVRFVYQRAKDMSYVLLLLMMISHLPNNIYLPNIYIFHILYIYIKGSGVGGGGGGL